MGLYDLAAYIGLLTVAYVCYKIWGIVQFIFHPSTFYRYAHNPNPNLKLDRQLSKPWALVTGASDGIGKALAKELCSRNFNVVLHGRPGPKLEKVRKELESEFKADIRTLALDAVSLFDERDWENTFSKAVLTSLTGINLTVVVNNVGGGGGIKKMYASVSEHSTREIEMMLNVNIRFMTHLTKVVLPILIANYPSIVVNISSGAEAMPSPWLATYAGAKAYVRQFSTSLRLELKAEGNDGVECVSLTPGKVVTAGSYRSDADLAFDTPSAETWARAALDRLGYDSPSYIPYIGHYLTLGAASILPQTIKDKFMISMMDQEVTKRYGTKKSK
jgi:17beta-estradiol 17-dehydrogenase / very-long-chain 3-oxoacyl-CoA reductase